VTALRRFWQGDLPLAEAFWIWGILGGGVLALFLTVFALMLLAFEVPTGWVVALMVLHVPANLYLLVGVWRSAGRPGVGPDLRLVARLVMGAWALVLSLI
jgi:hypothetical protein